MTLVQELRAQLERVARGPVDLVSLAAMKRAEVMLIRLDGGLFGGLANTVREPEILFLTTAIRRAVVTRERDGSC